MNSWNYIQNEVKIRAKGRSWLIRLPLMIYFVYLLIKAFNDPLYTDMFGLLNLGIHETGHLIFSFLGKFIRVLGGTLAQLLAPIISMIVFLKHKDYFAIIVAIGWLAGNFFNIAVYVADARVLKLPLVTPFGDGGEIGHDWNYLLDALGILQYEIQVAFIFRLIGYVLFIICIYWGFWLLYQMYKTRLKN